jgi:hypothetical protein
MLASVFEASVRTSRPEAICPFRPPSYGYGGGQPLITLEFLAGAEILAAPKLKEGAEHSPGREAVLSSGSPTDKAKGW